MDTDNRAWLSAPPRELALSFRREIVEPLFRSIYHGCDACQIIGMRGVGLSNLLRFICERRVIAYQLGEMAATTLLPVYLETSPLSETLDLYRAIVPRIGLQLKSFQWPIADLRLVQNTSARLTACENTIEAEAILSDLLGYLGHAERTRVVLIFDEFDHTLLTLPATTLRALRRLRDDHKRTLTFVTGTRTSLAALAVCRTTSDPFVEKFVDLFRVQLWVPPYSEADARDLMERRTVDWPRRLNDEQQADLYQVTGGHAKLLATALAYLRRRELPWAGVSHILLDEPALHHLCRELWNDLDTNEQAALTALALDRRQEVKYLDVLRLREKGLICGRPDGIFATVFEEFIRRAAN